jgi:hypothetical protein
MLRTAVDIVDKKRIGAIPKKLRSSWPAR